MIHYEHQKRPVIHTRKCGTFCTNYMGAPLCSIWMMTLDHRDFPVAKAKWDILSEKKREERGREGKEEERKEGERGKRKRETH